MAESPYTGVHCNAPMCLTEIGGADVPWLLKRAKRVRQLRLGHIYIESHVVNSIAEAVSQSDNSWEQLRWLEIECSILIGPSDWNERSLLLHSMLMWLLGSARQLAFLQLQMEEIRSVPCLTQLKHLNLVQKGSFKHLAGSLRHLPSLQTLSLESRAGDGHDPERRPHLDLAGLSQLHTVHLSGIVPASLTLPEGAALHLRMNSLEYARQEIWSSVALALQSISITCLVFITEVSQLPRIFAEPSGLKSVILCLDGFGDKEHPIEFYGAFLQAERLATSPQ